jgi:hypothetical protein
MLLEARGHLPQVVMGDAVVAVPLEALSWHQYPLWLLGSGLPNLGLTM